VRNQVWKSPTHILDIFFNLSTFNRGKQPFSLRAKPSLEIPDTYSLTFQVLKEVWNGFVQNW
jgi:hypothetical protein